MHSTAHPTSTSDQPAIRTLSLGAGVQSSALLLLACEGRIPTFDAAIFADTRWEPREVYSHLDRLDRLAADAGIPIHRVSTGDIRADALDPSHRFASMPLYVRRPDGKRGMGRRQCTAEYKLRPIKAKVREMIGYPPPARVPKGVYAEQAIGISVDEFHRAKDADVRYLRNVFPLLDLGWSRDDCRAYLADRGFHDTPKSSCLGCPYHGNRQWRHIRNSSPDEWADVVDFDKAIRNSRPCANRQEQHPRDTYYLHASCLPLDRIPLRTSSPDERGDPDGCSPWACRSGSAAALKADDGGRL